MLNTLAQQLVDFANSPDHAALVNSCERMYAGLFRDETPVRAGDLCYWDINDRFTFESIIDIPSFYEWAEYADTEQRTDEQYQKWVTNNYKKKTLITVDTLLVEVCNYKGEGEGYAVYDARMPVFVSKSASFASMYNNNI